MTFISSSEAKNLYFMSGEATNEIYIFLIHKPFYLYVIVLHYDIIHDRI